MLRQVQTDWRVDISKRYRCMKLFFRTLNENTSKESYGYKFQKFMRFTVDNKWCETNEDFNKLLALDSDKITDLLSDYVDFLEERGNRNVGTDLASPELFFQNNRKLWHRELVRGGIKRDKGMPGGDLPIEDKELEDVYFGSKHPRDRFIISALSSLGLRPAGWHDPVIRFKHLVPIENSYAVKIYDMSIHGYWGFLIPEARKDLETYKQWRINRGEKITDESPVLTTLPSRWNKKYDFMTNDNLSVLLERLIKGKVKRIKTGNRYNKALSTMFRKRFNTKLKLNNDVNSNVAELVMAHKLPGAQGNYTKPTMEECYVEVKKAIPELTIDPSLRKQVIIEQKKKENSDLQKKVDQIEEMKQQQADENVRRDQALEYLMKKEKERELRNF